MPGGDRTGPGGYGPRTGRGLGYCSGYDAPGFASPRGFGGRFGGGFGRGRGYGRGFGRGWRFQAAYAPPIYDAPSREDELAYLQDMQKSFEQGLEDVRKRLKELSDTVEKK
ncbi:MAG: DUF5320 domain-containing protein [Thermoplasmata archaeon]